MRSYFAVLIGAVVWICALALPVEAVEQKASRSVTLSEAVARALNSSPSAQAREELLTGAEAQIRQSDTLPNPEAELEVENFAGTGPFRGLEDSEMTFALTQRIERGGKRTARVAVAEAERDIASIERDTARLDVALETQRAFFDVSAETSLVEAAQARLAAAQEIEAMARRRVASARDPITVKLRAEIETADARSDYEQAMVGLSAAKARLASLWGESDANFSVDTSALLALPEARPVAQAGVAPAVRVREAAVRRAASNYELQNAGASSDVTVGLGVRRFENGDDFAGVVSVSIPLAVYDTNQGNIDRAAAEQRAAALDVEDAKRISERERMSLDEEVARAHAEATAIRRDLLPRAQEALNAGRRGYNAGAFSYLELSESERTLNELRKREIDALKRLHVALASLDRLSGRLVPPAAQEGDRK